MNLYKSAIDYCENMRKFAKSMMESHTVESDKNYEYYLGRMHSAKMIRDFLKREKNAQ